ncbi:hypothetical protein Goklo_028838 [Gossypium klotzschianum]|uniref:Uncharacterized protein n=1 Tax=Gossypium klotzschianum TaxID=34286 RepID=A0A7J8U2K5_9ROSI|nr:hypothetical protein [Gossypium klotzschianum]
MVKEGIIVNQVTIVKGLLIPNLNRCLHGRKKFCIEVGAMSWERFVEAKKNLYEHDKVYEWDDSAGLTAFQEAKQRFWKIYHGFPCENKLQSNTADLYNDDIDWNTKIDPKLFSEIKSFTDNEDKEKENAKEMDWFSIPLEEIQASRWDEFEEFAPHLPSIVGSP